MTDQTTWKRVCVLCAIRDRTTEIEEGHCCAACTARIGDDLASIVADGDLGALEARTGAGGVTGAGFESKPPTGLDGIAPYLALVRVNPGQRPAVNRSVANLISEWEIILRDRRGLAQYGPATEHHIGTDEGILAAQAVRQAAALLRSHLDWITADPHWPLEDFADEIARCARRMHAFAASSDRNPADRAVTCPTVTDDLTQDGEPIQCGARLTVRTWAALDASESSTGRADWSIGEHVTCPRCGATRSPEQLLRAAGKQDTWADPEAIARWYGVGQSTLRRWAARGEVRREHGRYSIADVEARRERDSA